MNTSGFYNWLLDEGKSTNTAISYVQDIELFGRWFSVINERGLTPQNLTATDAREYKQHLLDQNQKPSTINRALSSLRAWVRWNMDTGKLDRNPIRGIRGIQEQASAPKWLDRRQVNAILRELERDQAAARTAPARLQADRNMTAVVLMLNTGLRVSELCQVRMNDIEISDRKGSLHVRAGKGEKARDIPLNNHAREVITTWIESRQAESDWLFPGENNKSVNRRAIERILEDMSERTKTDITPHALRHTFAKSLVDAGVSLEKVAAILGHDSLDTTRRYTIPGRQDLEKAIGVLD